jgi:predicted RND superfamily exporter protein
MKRHCMSRQHIVHFFIALPLLTLGLQADDMEKAQTNLDKQLQQKSKAEKELQAIQVIWAKLG